MRKKKKTFRFKSPSRAVERESNQRAGLLHKQHITMHKQQKSLEVGSREAETSHKQIEQNHGV